MPLPADLKIVVQVKSTEGASVTLYSDGHVEFNELFPADQVARSIASILITKVGFLAPVERRLNEWFGSDEWKSLKAAAKQSRSFARGQAVVSTTQALPASDSETIPSTSMARTERQSVVETKDSIEGQSILLTR